MDTACLFIVQYIKVLSLALYMHFEPNHFILDTLRQLSKTHQQIYDCLTFKITLKSSSLAHIISYQCIIHLIVGIGAGKRLVCVCGVCVVRVFIPIAHKTSGY